MKMAVADDPLHPVSTALRRGALYPHPAMALAYLPNCWHKHRSGSALLHCGWPGTGMGAKTGIVVVPPAAGNWLNGDGAAYRDEVMKVLPAASNSFQRRVRSDAFRRSGDERVNDGGDLSHLWQAC